MCIDFVEICFGIAIGYIPLMFDRVISLWHYNSGVLSFHVFIMMVVLVQIIIIIIIIVILFSDSLLLSIHRVIPSSFRELAITV